MLLLSVFAITLNSCKSRKLQSLQESPPIEEITLSEYEKKIFIDSLGLRQFQFDYLSARAKVKIESDGKVNNVVFNMRLQKDTQIWVSVTALGGLEVARVLLTTDSVKILDRINSRYMTNDYAYISELLKNEINFLLIQHILTGTATIDFMDSRLSFLKDAQYAELSLADSNPFNKLIYDISTSNLVKNEFRDPVLKQQLLIQYGDFKTVDNSIFPFLINSLASSEKESVKLEVQYTKVEKSASLDFPFTVPKKYE